MHEPNARSDDENGVVDPEEIDPADSINPDQTPNRALSTVSRGGPLVIAGIRVLFDSPAGAYLASLRTPKSRLTAVEAMRRIGRALGGSPDDPGAWTRIPWARLEYRHTNLIRARLLEQNSARGKPLGPESVRLTLSVLRGVLRSAFRLNLMPAEQYTRAVDWGRVRGQSEPVGRMLQPEEIERLFTYCDGLRRGRREMMRALLSCGLGGGLRREELAVLRVDGVHGSALRFIGKGQKPAEQPLPEWAARDVADWVAVRARAKPALQCVTLFVQFRGDQARDLALTVHMVWSYVRELCDGSGVEPFTTHDLRRTFISRMLAKDLGIAKTLARHENVSTTLGYDRRGEKAADEALKGFTRS